MRERRRVHSDGSSRMMQPDAIAARPLALHAARSAGLGNETSGRWCAHLLRL
jgi:hypothetical protein